MSATLIRLCSVSAPFSSTCLRDSFLSTWRSLRPSSESIFSAMRLGNYPLPVGPRLRITVTFKILFFLCGCSISSFFVRQRARELRVSPDPFPLIPPLGHACRSTRLLGTVQADEDFVPKLPRPMIEGGLLPLDLTPFFLFCSSTFPICPVLRIFLSCSGAKTIF